MIEFYEFENLLSSRAKNQNSKMINAQSLSSLCFLYKNYVKCFRYKSHERLASTTAAMLEFELTLVDTLIQTSQRFAAAILPVVLLIKITDENIPSLILIPVV